VRSHSEQARLSGSGIVCPPATRVVFEKSDDPAFSGLNGLCGWLMCVMLSRAARGEQ
jgi:hypothetical protein